MELTDKLFEYNGPEENKRANHLITTDHPWFAEIGLSAFTTGTLYNWWHELDHKGKYKNRKILAGDTGDTNEPPNWLYYGFEQEIYFHPFQAWRQVGRVVEGKGNDNAGKYVDQYLPTALSAEAGTNPKDRSQGIKGTWSYISPKPNPQGIPASYDESQILSLLGWSSPYFGTLGYYRYDGATNLTSTLHRSDGRVIERKKKDDTWFSSVAYEQLNGIYDGPDPILGIISLNDWYLDHSLRNLDQTIKASWGKDEFAAQAFLRDIKTSKDKCLSWTSVIPFNINLAEGAITCVKDATATFKLHLSSNTPGRGSSRSLTFASPKIVAPPKTATGREYSTTQDGGLEPYSHHDPTEQVVGDLDLNYTEYLKKWEAGTKQVVAVVSKDIPPATRPDVETIKTMNNKQALDNPEDASLYFGWGLGEAIIISMQNGNPSQWSPTYATCNTCPEDRTEERSSTEKITLKVFNVTPSVITKDTIVFLNRIDGQWFASTSAPGKEAELSPLDFEGKWSFEYFATSATHYFRDADWTTVTPERAEQAFIQAYYFGLHESWHGHVTKTVEPIVPWYAGPTNKKDWLKGEAGDGYYQFTSFDFMDPACAGTRDIGIGSKERSRGWLDSSPVVSFAYGGRALSTTNPTITPMGQPIYTQDLDSSDGMKNGVFFGCVFPDGYISTSYADYLAVRDYNVKGDSLGGTYESKLQYFNKDETNGLAIAKDVLPFDDSAGYETRSDVFDVGGGGGGIPTHEDSHTQAGQVQTMFSNTSMLLNHLPADIGTNASIDGVNGQPIKNIHMLDGLYQYYDTDHPGYGMLNDTFREVKKFFQQGLYWLRKSDVAADIEESYTDWKASSAFDFEPMVNNRVMFCPLKAEVYAAVGGKPAVEAAEMANKKKNKATVWPIDQEYGEPNYSDLDEYDPVHNRKHFGGQAALQMTSTMRPMSLISQNREVSVTDYDGTDDGGSNVGLIWDEFGLHFNASIPPTGRTQSSNKQFNDSMFLAQYYKDGVGSPAHIPRGRKRWDVWDPTMISPDLRWIHGMMDYNSDGFLEPPYWYASLWEGALQEGAGAGAVGVIGAVATCTARQTIDFSVDNRLGIYSFIQNTRGPVGGGTSAGLGGTGSVQGGVITFTNNTPGARSTKTTPGWGPTDRPQDFHTTALHATVYHAHPRDQTIYDSRYFAVHHFNPDIDTQDYDHDQDETTLPGIEKSYFNVGLTGEQQRHAVGSVADTFITSDGTVHDINVDQIGSSVDYRVPAHFSLDNNSIESVAFSNGLLFSNGSAWTDEETLSHEVLPEDKWPVESMRRGKCLPFTYGRWGIGISLKSYEDHDAPYDISQLGSDGGYIDTAGTAIAFTAEKVLTQNALAILESAGTGYAKGDQFTTTAGSGVVIEVGAIGDGGKITQFEVISQGIDIPQSSFMRHNAEIDAGSSSSVYAVPLGEGDAAPKGKGFSLKFVCGADTYTEMVDPKPTLVARNTRLTSRPPTNGTAEGVDAFSAYIQEVKETSISIGSPSSDGRYDIFFHFHNDISHTFLTDEWKGSNQAKLATTQFADLTITMT